MAQGNLAQANSTQATMGKLNLYYDKDCNPDLIKSKTVAVIGYGSQGHAHAQNMKDSGVSSVIISRPGTMKAPYCTPSMSPSREPIAPPKTTK